MRRLCAATITQRSCGFAAQGAVGKRRRAALSSPSPANEGFHTEAKAWHASQEASEPLGALALGIPTASVSNDLDLSAGVAHCEID